MVLEREWKSEQQNKSKSCSISGRDCCLSPRIFNSSLVLYPPSVPEWQFTAKGFNTMHQMTKHFWRVTGSPAWSRVPSEQQDRGSASVASRQAAPFGRRHHKIGLRGKLSNSSAEEWGCDERQSRSLWCCCNNTACRRFTQKMSLWYLRKMAPDNVLLSKQSSEMSQKHTFRMTCEIFSILKATSDYSRIKKNNAAFLKSDSCFYFLWQF